MNRRAMSLVLLACLAVAPLFAQSAKANAGTEFQSSGVSYLSLSLLPSLTIPLGQDATYFNLGGQVELEAAYRLPALPWLYLSGALGYGLLPVEFGSSVSAVSGGIGVGAVYELPFGLSVYSGVSGGYFYGLLNDGSGPSGGNPYLFPYVGIMYPVTATISIGLETGYSLLFGLYNGLNVGLGTSISLGGKSQAYQLRTVGPQPLIGEGSVLGVEELVFEDVLPMFYKHYDDNPVGTAVLVNPSREPVEDLKVSLFVKQYMDNPKQCQAPTELSPRQRQEISLNALFTERVLEITETTKVSAEITMDYTVRGQRLRQSHVETLRIFDRNAVTWDDDRKAAVFVTTKDPAVLTFSKNIASLIQDKGSRAISENLRSAIAFHQALGLYGLSYVVDPTTPYKEYSARKTAVDYLQFPRQTLQYKAGDCDDLSVLYCALLESVGVETAFITLPGHIYMAFSVDMTPEEARKRFFNHKDLIFRGDKAWVPVEITELNGGFLDAWAAGAKQWREALSRNQQGFYPTREAWQAYEPVGLAGEGSAVELPPSDKILSAYLQELLKFVDREIYPQITAIQAEIRKSGENARLLNKLGVVYARYGLDDKASEQFRKALSRERNYLPSLLNLGNVYYLAGNLAQAKYHYELAYRLSPGNPNAMLAVARVNHDLENYGVVSELYAALRNRDPELAERYAYLEMRGSDAARAAAAGRIKETVQWEEQ